MAVMGIEYVLDKLRWMRAEHIWPNGLRYLWTDAFGVVLLVSLYRALAKDEFLDDAEWAAANVGRVLGRPRGIRIGEEPDRDGQYFHYLPMWLYALAMIGRHIPRYRERGHRSRSSGPRRLSGARAWRDLENEGGPERPLSRLWLRRARCLRWIRFVPDARSKRAFP